MTFQKSDAMTNTVRGLLDQRTLSERGQALADGMQVWFSTASECQREMAHFISNRLEKDSDTMREMIGCRNPADAMEIHMRWIQEWVQDYGAEMTRILAITTRHAGNAAQRRH
jgi:hypothetical protein